MCRTKRGYEGNRSNTVGESVLSESILMSTVSSLDAFLWKVMRWLVFYVSWISEIEMTAQNKTNQAPDSRIASCCRCMRRDNAKQVRSPLWDCLMTLEKLLHGTSACRHGHDIVGNSRLQMFLRICNISYCERTTMHGHATDLMSRSAVSSGSCG